MDRGAWWAAVHGVAKSQTQLSDFTFTVHFHALEKEMATHSSVLAWRIPGTGEPGGLLSMGSQSRTQLKQLSSSNSNTKKSIFDHFHVENLMSELSRSLQNSKLHHPTQKKINGTNKPRKSWQVSLQVLKNENSVNGFYSLNSCDAMQREAKCPDEGWMERIGNR